MSALARHPPAQTTSRSRPIASATACPAHSAIVMSRDRCPLPDFMFLRLRQNDLEVPGRNVSLTDPDLFLWQSNLRWPNLKTPQPPAASRFSIRVLCFTRRRASRSCSPTRCCRLPLAGKSTKSPSGHSISGSWDWHSSCPGSSSFSSRAMWPIATIAASSSCAATPASRCAAVCCSSQQGGVCARFIIFSRFSFFLALSVPSPDQSAARCSRNWFLKSISQMPSPGLPPRSRARPFWDRLWAELFTHFFGVPQPFTFWQ